MVGESPCGRPWLSRIRGEEGDTLVLSGRALGVVSSVFVFLDASDVAASAVAERHFGADGRVSVLLEKSLGYVDELVSQLVRP